MRGIFGERARLGKVRLAASGEIALSSRPFGGAGRLEPGTQAVQRPARVSSAFLNDRGRRPPAVGQAHPRLAAANVSYADGCSWTELSRPRCRTIVPPLAPPEPTARRSNLRPARSMTLSDPYKLARFVEAQASTYSTALAEI